MNLANLPEEVLIIIMKQLDIRSLHNMYNTCTYIRNIVCMHGVIKECHMSLNTLATVKSLKLNFFKDISRHLQELNMSGVHDLCKTSLLPAINKLKSLKTLNIAYTNINILDFVEIYAKCSTIRNITINFHFGQPAESGKLPKQKMTQCQKIFQHIENVHFVGCYLNLLRSNIPKYVLKLATLDTLTYTIAEQNFKHYYQVKETGVDLKFNEFQVYLLNWKVQAIFSGNVFDLLNLNNFEYVIIRVLYQDSYDVYCSQLFKKFFKDNFGVNTISTAHLVQHFEGNIAIMVWNKSSDFDDSFFSNLFKKVQQYFPCNYLHSRGKEQNLHENDWFCMLPEERDLVEIDTKNHEPECKRRRVAPINVLNYDEMFKEKRNVELRLHFCNYRYPITLSTKSNYLKKLTYLNITGPVRYSTEFFNILFRCSENLVTLNIEGTSLSQCAFLISRFIPLSNSLKNLRIIDRQINCNKLFTALSFCKTLENIHVHDVSSEFNDLADTNTLFKECDNLYYFFIYASMSDSARTSKLQMMKNAKIKCGKYHINVELHNNENSIKYFYEPFVDVFKLSPIKHS